MLFPLVIYDDDKIMIMMVTKDFFFSTFSTNYLKLGLDGIMVICFKKVTKFFKKGK